ncbi:DUF4136 domain-containing protein [Sneathiella marina]|uniref:DUF4136 domain-containing protein n=1 Tax=Sneathiella marina TaxID=2950108 RepID=A0ABY4W107_9PROT|nr:DUF4136 domain-containing protein [Sneathiella marina]USG60652.1 DUF4136 domain-containing protein [Sneathiella marina]
MKALLFIALATILVACGTPAIDANITAFYTPEVQNIASKTITVRAQPASKDSSLEFKSYRPKIESKLRLVGFDIAEPNEDPDFVAYVSYGIDGKEQRSSTTSDPYFGSFGVGVGVGRAPFYGGVARSYNTQTWEEYNRFISLDIVEGASVGSDNPVRIYEGRVQSVGKCPTLAGVFDGVLDAMFENFPGLNGKTTFISIPWDGSC